LKSPGVNITNVALALTLACFLTPNAIAATDGQNLPESQRLLDDGQTVVGSDDRPNGHRWVTAKILINACPHVVWDTVHEERQRDPDLSYSKVLGTQDNQATLEQKFCLLPLFGTATCVMHNVEVVNERIDYDMVSSDHFKALEGSWILTPGRDASSTYLELESYCDLGLPIPRPMIDGITTRKIQRRLANVKVMAEAAQTRLALHKGN
jgi:hypothetical protein